MINLVRRFYPLFFICLLLAYGIDFTAAQSEYPKHSNKYVNDYADVISSIDEMALRAMLSDLKEQTGIEATVLTVESIRDYRNAGSTIESFATNVFNEWGIGDPARNDGLLVLVAVSHRQVRLEVGSGYGREFDSAMQQVIDKEMLPRFRREQYSHGIFEGTRAAALALSGGTFEPPSRTPLQIMVNVGRTGLRYWWAILIGIVTIFFVGVPVTRKGIKGIRSRIPPACSNCGQRMQALKGQTNQDQHLSPAQKLEMKLGAATYKGWQCPRCANIDFVPEYLEQERISDCPKCQHRTVEKYVTVRAATKEKPGLMVNKYSCQNCDYVHEERTEINYNPAAQRSSILASQDHDDDFGSFDSGNGNDSFGGGSSSGGGASGTW